MVSVPVVSPNTPALAADFNSLGTAIVSVDNSVSALAQPPQLVVYRNAAYTVPASSVPLLQTWDAEELDTQNNFTVSSSRLTAATAARWTLQVLHTLTAIPVNGSESVLVQARLNSAGSSSGGTALSQNRMASINGVAGYLYSLDDFPMNAGDYVEIFIQQTRTAGGISGQTGRYSTYAVLRKIST